MDIRQSQRVTPDDQVDASVHRWAAALLDELPDGVLVLCREGRIEAANRTFLELTGRRAEQVVGHALESLVAEEDVLQIVGFDAVFGDARTSDNNISFLTADGSRRAFVVCSVRSRDGQRVLMTVRASGQVQEELADASRWAAAERQRSLELAAARDALAAKNTALSAAQAELQAAYARLQAESERRERLENELRLAQRLEAIGQLAAGVAHEINTPMQYIGDNVHFLSKAFGHFSGCLDLVASATTETSPSAWPAIRSSLVSAQEKLKKKQLTTEIPKALEAARDGVEHVSRIVQAMRSFAHHHGDDKTPTDINRTVQNTLTVAQNEYKEVARVETDFAELPPVNCYPGKLNQVFLNLIINAAHAIQDAKRPGRGLIRVQSRPLAGAVEVRVSDDGCGIPAHIADKVFDQFFTTKPVGRGTGQGLSLSRNIVVEAHGGTLTFETELGVGTTFIVRLPLDAPAPAPP